MTKSSKNLYVLVWLLALPLFLLGPRAAFGGKQAAGAQSMTAGQAAVQFDYSKASPTETCAHCHKDSADQIARTVHSGPYDTGKNAHGTYYSECDACHGSSKAHADAEILAEKNDTKDPEAAKLIYHFDGTPEAKSAPCQTCHASDQSHIDSANSFHRLNEVACIDCHTAHHGTAEKLLVKEQPDLCYTCHLQQRAQFEMPFHHLVNEHLIRCTDCHNQHGSGGVWESDHPVQQVRSSDSGDVICFKCHKDKQGPFVFPHASVKIEGCGTCHIPHGGANVHMLKYADVNLLCLRCHTSAAFGHTTAAGLNGKPTGFPVMNGPAPNNAIYIQSCTICHTAIHGSNFSDIYFR